MTPLLIALVVTLAGAVTAAAAVSTACARRARRREAETGARKLEAFLAGRSITAPERRLLEDLARLAGEPLERVATLVLCFDRGVDRYLGGRAAEPPEERLIRLRKLKTLRAKLALDRVPPGVPLLSSREIPPGQELVLRFRYDPGGQVHGGTLLDLDDAGLSIRMPGLSPAGPSFPPGSAEVDVYFVLKDEGTYRFSSEVIQTLEEPEAILHLAHPQKLWREPKKDPRRVPVQEEVRFRRLGGRSGESGPGVAGAPLEAPGTILDLSQGGFRLLASGGRIRLGDRIALDLPFLEAPFDREVISARAVQLYGSRGEVGFAFEALPPPVAAAVLQHVEEKYRLVNCIL